MNNFKFALRAFARTPATSLVVVVTLAVAIAAGAVIVSIIDAVGHMIPGTVSDRQVFVASTDPRPSQARAGSSGGVARTGVSIPDLMDWSERATTIQEFAGFTFGSANLTAIDVPLRVESVRLTTNLLSVWDIRPTLGRGFRSEEEKADAPPVVLLSDAFWERQFSRAPSVLGRILVLDGKTHTIVGVLPPEAGTGLFRPIDVFLPLVLDRARAARDERSLLMVAVLKPGVTREQAGADLGTVARQLSKEYPTTNARTGVVVRPAFEMLGGNIQSVVYLLGLIGVLVVCIACANASNIILARSTTRRREFAVRSALGASRFGQIRQLMAESFVSSCVAGAFGVALAWWGLDIIRLVAGDMVAFSEMTLNGRVLGIAVIVALVAPFGFALLPAVRMSTPDMDELRQGNRGAQSTHGRGARGFLVAVQVALALVLMVQVGLIARTTWKLHNLEKGFDPESVLTLRIDLPQARYAEPRTARDFFAQILARVQAIPGVVSAGAVTRLPIGDRELIAPFAIAGRPVPLPGAEPAAARSSVSADYLKTMRIPVLRGRSLGPIDFGDVPPVALVNAAAARAYWPNQNPIGARISFDASEPDGWMEVVGVIANVRNSNAGSEPSAQIYVPASWRPERSMAIVVRASGGDPTDLAPAIRREVAQIDKDQPIYEVATMKRVLFEDLGGTYLLTALLGVIGCISLCLAGAGVYGLISYSVSQQTRDIGLRMALGAQPSEVVNRILIGGTRPVVIGLGLGAVGSALLAYLASTAMEEIDLRDPIGYLCVVVPLLLIAFFASYIPARRATQIDPILALKAE